MRKLAIGVIVLALAAVALGQETSSGGPVTDKATATTVTAAQASQTIQQALAGDPTFANVKVSAENNQIVLSGTVITPADKERAEERAIESSGATLQYRIVNRISVNSSKKQ